MFSAFEVCRSYILTLKIAFSDTSDGEGTENMEKCLMKRGVTGLRPPPGGAQAAQMVISYKQQDNLYCTMLMHVQIFCALLFSSLL